MSINNLANLLEELRKSSERTPFLPNHFVLGKVYVCVDLFMCVTITSHLLAKPIKLPKGYRSTHLQDYLIEQFRCRSTPSQIHLIGQKVSINTLADLFNWAICSGRHFCKSTELTYYRGIDRYHCKPIAFINTYRLLRKDVRFILEWHPRVIVGRQAS